MCVYDVAAIVIIVCLMIEIIEKVKKPPPLIRPSVSKGAAPPEAIHIMRQCWTEQPEMRPDFCQVHDLFRKLNHGRYLYSLLRFYINILYYTYRYRLLY